MSQRQPLILDIDSTLIHMEPLPGSLVIPGRTRHSYMAPQTIDLLAALAAWFDLVLATGRSWAGIRVIVEELARRGVPLWGMCIENGGLISQVSQDGQGEQSNQHGQDSQNGQPIRWQLLEPLRNWRRLRAVLDSRPSPTWPLFRWQDDFTSCLVARAETAQEAARLAPALLAQARTSEADLAVFLDGRKVYLMGRAINKWQALRALLGNRAAQAWGMGDGLNDVCWLKQIALPCTLRGSAPEVVDIVAAAGGIISSQERHAGTGELLQALLSAQRRKEHQTYE